MLAAGVSALLIEGMTGSKTTIKTRTLAQTSMPKVSIVIPVYNVEKHLAACLDSVLAQTLSDIEVICVDDGSKDRSGEILDTYAVKDSRIRVIHQVNAGPSAARNNGIDLASGNYILFVDGDDFVDSMLCEKAVAVADCEKADMTCFFWHHFPNRTKPNPFEKCAQMNSKEELYRGILLYNPVVWSKLWRTDFWRDNNLSFPLNVACGEDLVVNFAALLKNPVLVVLPEKLYWYRENPNSITRSYANVNIFHDVGECFDIIRKNLEKGQRYDGFWKELLLERKLRSFYSRSLRIDQASMSLLFEILTRYYGDDERFFVKFTNKLRWDIRDFYLAFDGSGTAKIKNMLNRFLIRCYFKIFKNSN